MSLESARSLINEDLNATDQFIMTELDSHIPLITNMIEYILSCGGKRIRPMILLLSAKAINPSATKHIELAAVVELIHTATLLHDDVVDGSTLRRGHDTAHTIWGNEASVLVGDFLYSRAFQIVVNLQSMPILNIFAKATHFMAEGEILQLTNRHNPETTESFYFDIIERKTAKLFEVASELGAMVTTQNQRDIKAMQTFGREFGLAYQLIDDALDYSQPAEETGKNICQDLADGKATLPYIHAMRQSSGKTLQMLKNAIKNGSVEHLTEILAVIESTDAIRYTADAAKSHADRAKLALADISASPYRTALEDLCDFVVARTF